MTTKPPPPKCPHCDSVFIRKLGPVRHAKQKWGCTECSKTWWWDAGKGETRNA